MTTAEGADAFHLNAHTSIKLLKIREIIEQVSDHDPHDLQLKAAKIDMALQSTNEAIEYMAQGYFEFALRGATQALRFQMEVYGTGSLELIGSYLLLAEAYIGIGKFKQAEENLSLASWSVIKANNCSDYIKAVLNRTFGKLYAAQGLLEKAKTHLAKNIFFCTRFNGTKTFDTADGYFLLGTVLLAEGIKQKKAALSFFSKSVEIWKDELDGEEAQINTNEFVLNEAGAMFEVILSYRKQESGEAHKETADINYVLALIYAALEDTPKSHECFTVASGIYKACGSDDMVDRIAQIVPQ